MKNVNIDIVPILHEVAKGQITEEKEYHSILKNDKKEVTRIFLNRFENSPVLITEARQVKKKEKTYFIREKRLPVLIKRIMERQCVSRSTARQAILNLKAELMN